jgi:NitT/TauT family transport system substrate-binding protein
MRTVTVGPNGPAYDLPWIVGEEQGFFAEEGLVIRVLDKDVSKPQALSLAERQKERLFDAGEIDVFNACEWGCLRRVERARRRAWLIARRPLLETQSIVDLAGRPVAVAWETGGHYLTLKMLEGFLPREEIRCVHGGFHRNRLEALLAGEVAAAILPEPFTSLAEQRGCRVVCEAVFRGGEVVHDSIDAETAAKLIRALRRAVEFLNRDVERYRRRILAMERPGDLSYDDVNWRRIAYLPPKPYTRAEFERARDWMRSWGMIGEGIQFEQVVNPALAEAAAG